MVAGDNRRGQEVLTKDQQFIQELLSHPGWGVYKGLVMNGFRDRLQRDLQSSARSGDQIRSAGFAGQIDLLPIVLDIPVKFLKG